MTIIYNKHLLRNRRRELRHSLPPAEVLLWQYLKGRRVAGFKFRRQYSVGNYVVDFYCPRLKLAIEVDGPSHYQSEKAIAYDKQRQKFLESFGISFIRVTNHDIYSNLSGVIDFIYTVASSE
ncbi:MAG: endonuclease domain-containing protein [Candidatus Komeilibacteria bacterium]|nr:endonuclease domain-containing protein [Candidatus Komeilibacteria bacterium]